MGARRCSWPPFRRRSLAERQADLTRCRWLAAYAAQAAIGLGNRVHVLDAQVEGVNK
jgi:hypothetical protein